MQTTTEAKEEPVRIQRPRAPRPQNVVQISMKVFMRQKGWTLTLDRLEKAGFTSFNAVPQKVPNARAKRPKYRRYVEGFADAAALPRIHRITGVTTVEDVEVIGAGPRRRAQA